jgi:hypothetical protein
VMVCISNLVRVTGYSHLSLSRFSNFTIKIYYDRFLLNLSCSIFIIFPSLSSLHIVAYRPVAKQSL